MSRISTTYALRRFTSSNDSDYPKALSLYVSTIGPGSRTNSNEITYWLDRYSREYSDEFCVCGFYRDSKIIGYVEFAYFRQERIITIDYLLLHKSYRTHGEYFQFSKMIQDWIDREGYEFDFVVAEVSFETSGKVPSERSILLVRLFKSIGFSVAKCAYYQAPLGLNNPESDVRAHLLLWTRERIRSIKGETLLNIVSALYFKYNERWFKPFLDNTDEYHSILTRRFRQLADSLRGRAEIELNGFESYCEPILPVRVPRASKSRQLLPPVLAISAIWLLCLGLLLLQERFRLSIVAILEITGVSLIAFLSVYAIFYSRGERVLDKILDFVKFLTKLFGKRK